MALLAGTSIPSAPPVNLFPKSSGSSRRRSRGGFNRVTIEVQGLNAVIENFFTIAELTHQLTPGLVYFFDDTVFHNARQFVRKKTWATHDSIHSSGPIMSGSGDFSAWISAESIAARFLEFGTINMPAYPFMLPAVDMIEKDFIRAFVEIAKIPDQLSRTGLSGDVGRDSRVRSPISALRSGLYSTSKFLGDISVLGGRSTLSPIRGFALSMARLLGDMNAAMTGQIATRFSTRLRGRATGRLAGFGSASLTASKTYSGSFTGGQRIYNRLVGRISSPIISTNFPGL